MQILADRRKRIVEATGSANAATSEEAKATIFAHDVSTAMVEVRHACDELESIVADDHWPLPKYREMLFLS
ncbi:hypothetical protein BH09MYX1_BH09MYX1_61890 [soil metagenome]